MNEKRKEEPSLIFHHLPFEERMKQVKNLSNEEDWVQGLLLGDEWANSLTHGIGLLLSVIGMFILIMTPMQEGDHWKLINFGVYGLSLVLLYGSSTLYHFSRSPELKKLFRLLDHCAIYLLIAGTYTPFTMLLLEGGWGMTLFSIVWSLAAIGILFKIYFKTRFKFISTSIYLFMGWMVVIAAEPLMARFHYAGLMWIVAGGLFYTCGVIFYVMDKRKFFHAIWHLFVMCGSVCHYLAVFFYL